MNIEPLARRAVWAYLRRIRGFAALFAVFLLLLFGVYGLYGLPPGPAAYVALLCSCAAIAGGVYGFLRYYRLLKRLRILAQQDTLYAGDLPYDPDMAGQEYQRAIKALRETLGQTQERLRKNAQDAAQYYTLWTHQIKTPLSAMRLLLQEEPPDAAGLELELLKTEQYVDMALQYQRLDGVTRDLMLAQYPLDGLVRKAVKKLAALFIYKDIELSLHPLPGVIVTDEKWLVFVLEQLLSNAVKYTPAHGQVSIRLLDGSKTVLTIEDTGIGILPQDLPRVFEWGYTGYNARGDQRSTGLGLFLCKQAMDMLGHTITLHSTVGQGTRAELTLSRGTLEIE